MNAKKTSKLSLASFRNSTVDTIWLILLCSVMLGGCGSLTGIPGHGGGKRFAIEQELVAAATRATLKQIDLTTIRGKKVNLFVNAIGDTGAGNLLGGRFSLVSQLRGDYIQSPPVTEKSIFPRYTSTTTTSSRTDTSSDSDNSSTTDNGEQESTSTGRGGNSSTSTNTSTSTTETLLPSPERTISKQKGSGAELQLGLEYKGLGAYKSSEEISSNDLQYLSGLLQTYLYLRGVNVVPPSEAEVDVYITVDVFGTVHTRVEWFLANNEILKAKTALEVMAVDHLSGMLVMEPQAASIEAEYNEQYILWAGPISIKKYLKKSQPLLSDFTNLKEESESLYMSEQNGTIPYPFQRPIQKWRNKD